MASGYDVHTPMTPYAETGKVIFALWGEGLEAALLDPGLHTRLTAAGGVRLQVNLDDAAVAEAMRIPTGPPIGAIVSVWAPAEPATVDQVTTSLRGICSRVAGWRVDERRPLSPDEVWDGSRLDALANVALLRQPGELDHQTWRDRWLVDHTEVAIETQGTFGYIQNLVVDAVTDDAPPVHAIVEELFPCAAITDMHAFYGSGGDDAELETRLTRMMASVTRIGADRDLNLVPTSRYLFPLSP